MEAEILKVAGLPGWTGSGTICTPLTFTGYFLPLPARHSKGEVTSRAFHTPRENRRLSRAQTERGVSFRGRDTHCSSRRRWRPRRRGGGGGRRRRRRGRGGSACSPWRPVDSLCRGCVRWEDLFVRERDLRGGIYKKEEELGRWGKR